jgi:mannose-1-phosphate guanylyltransferase
LQLAVSGMTDVGSWFGVADETQRRNRRNQHQGHQRAFDAERPMPNSFAI